MRQPRGANALEASVAIRLLVQLRRANNARLAAAGACSLSLVGLGIAENVKQDNAQHAFSLLDQ